MLPAKRSRIRDETVAPAVEQQWPTVFDHVEKNLINRPLSQRSVIVEIPDELPESWIEAAEAEAGHEVPSRLSEPALPDSGMGAAVDSIIDRCKATVFPGLIG